MLLSASFLNANPFLSCLSTYRWAFIKQILLKQHAYLFILTSKNCPKNFQTTVCDWNLFLRSCVSSFAVRAYSYANTEVFPGLEQGENVLPDKTRCSNNRHIPTSAEPQSAAWSSKHPAPLNCATTWNQREKWGQQWKALASCILHLPDRNHYHCV